jgi:hypothetical protein
MGTFVITGDVRRLVGGCRHVAASKWLRTRRTRCSSVMDSGDETDNQADVRCVFLSLRLVG